MAEAILITHAGAEKITRADLELIPTPERTETFQPINHFHLINQLEEALAFRHISIVREEYAVTPDGMKLFGALEVDSETEHFRFAIGIRNANDRSMRLGIVAGTRTVVCDNLLFRGDFEPVLAKHSKKFDLTEALCLGVDRIQRGWEPLRQQIEYWMCREITDEFAKLVLYDAFVERKLKVSPKLLAVAHDHYFKDERFPKKTFYRLSNCLTSAIKELSPAKHFEAAAKVGVFLNTYN